MVFFLSSPIGNLRLIAYLCCLEVPKPPEQLTAQIFGSMLRRLLAPGEVPGLPAHRITSRILLRAVVGRQSAGAQARRARQWPTLPGVRGPPATRTHRTVPRPALTREWLLLARYARHGEGA